MSTNSHLDEQQEKYERARMLIEKRDFGRAEMLLAELEAERFPGSSELLGYVLLHHGGTPEAVDRGVALLTHSFERAPTENIARQLAYFYNYKRHDFDKALKYYNSLVELGAWEANYNIGKILTQRPNINSILASKMSPHRYFETAAKNGHIFSAMEIKKIQSKSGLGNYISYLYSRFITLPIRLIMIVLSNTDDRRIRR